MARVAIGVNIGTGETASHVQSADSLVGAASDAIAAAIADPTVAGNGVAAGLVDTCNSALTAVVTAIEGADVVLSFDLTKVTTHAQLDAAVDAARAAGHRDGNLT